MSKHEDKRGQAVAPKANPGSKPAAAPQHGGKKK